MLQQFLRLHCSLSPLGHTVSYKSTWDCKEWQDCSYWGWIPIRGKGRNFRYLTYWSRGRRAVAGFRLLSRHQETGSLHALSSILQSTQRIFPAKLSVMAAAQVRVLGKIMILCNHHNEKGAVFARFELET